MIKKNKNLRVEWATQTPENGALQNAIFNSANFSSIATDAKGVIQIFNVGAENMLGYKADEVMNKITPADISDPQEVIARAKALTEELETPIAPGFEALVFKASRGIEDIYELTYIRKDGSHFPAIVSVTALRDDQDAIIGYLLIGTDNTARKQAEEALIKAGALQNAIFNSANFSSIATDAKGVIQIFNVGAENMLGYKADEVMNKITPADISDPQEVIARAKALTEELETPIAPGFEALVFKASRGIEDIYELTYIRKDGSHFPAIVSVTALRDDQDAIIGYLLIGTDNTARKQAEDKLRLSDVALKHISQGILISNHEQNILWVNDAFTSITGYSRTEILGQNCRFMSGPHTDQKTLSNMRLAIKNNTTFSGEILNYRKDGTLFWNELTISPVFEEQGQLTNFISSTRDITERKRIDHALRESEFLWKFAIEGSGDGVWDRNLLTNEMHYSRRWKEMLGYTEHDILPTRQEWIDRIHPDDKLLVKTAMQAYLNGEAKSYSTEYRLSCKDDHYKWILARGVVVDYAEEGTPLRMIGTHTDISAFKQIQDTLQEKERMLSESQHIGHIGSWSLDLATGLLNWSDEMYLIFGVTPEVFEHTRVAISDLILPEDLDLRNSWFNDALKGEGIRELVFRIRLPDGSIRFICSTGEVLYDALNKPLRFVGSSQDISERKYKEQQDKEHLNQLAHVTRLGLMGEMASGIAHEVNQPLTAIATYTQASLNLMKAENPNMDKLAEVVYKTQQQALRAGQIIRRMREFVKSNTKQVAATDLNELIQDAVSLCLPELKLGNIALTLQLQSPLPLINVDKIQIEQVIINLIRNSVDAFDSCLENQQKEISIDSLLTLNEGIEVRVKDNGSGIPDDQQQQILMPFYTTKTEGMGMGLSICCSIIEAHGGYLKFNSKVGKGTTFYFTLPIKKDTCF